VRPGRNEALRILERSPFKMAFPGLGKENYRFHDHEKLAHYANAQQILNLIFPLGLKRGYSPCTDFDFKAHEQFQEENYSILMPN
jgi:glycyl-tRNA synthetase